MSLQVNRQGVALAYIFREMAKGKVKGGPTIKPYGIMTNNAMALVPR